MERKEPTLSSNTHNATSNNQSNERESAAQQRSMPSYERAMQIPAQSPSPLPVAALVIALLGVAGGLFLGWQLSEALVALNKADARITQLDNQLNITSTESTASLGSLQVNLLTLSSDVKILRDTTRKATVEHTEKLQGLNKSAELLKNELTAVKGDTNSLKQDALAQKITADELVPHVDTLDKAMVEQRKRTQDLSANVTTLLGQVKAAESLAARVNTTEEAIDAIDDNRRTINRDLLQIKQQLGIK